MRGGQSHSEITGPDEPGRPLNYPLKRPEIRHTAGLARILAHRKDVRERLDVYIPPVHDFGIDAVFRQAADSFIEAHTKSTVTKCH